MFKIKLSQIKINESAKVCGFECDENLRCGFKRIGIEPGTNITLLHISPLGDPKAYRIMGAVMALREEAADFIIVDGDENE